MKKRISFLWYLLQSVYVSANTPLNVSELPKEASEDTKETFQEGLFTLSINQEDSSSTLIVLLHPQGDIFVEFKDFESFNLDKEYFRKSCNKIRNTLYINIRNLPDSQLSVDEENYHLSLVVPAKYFKGGVYTTESKKDSAHPSLSTYGGFINYNITGTNTSENGQNLSALPELNIFTPKGSFLSTFFASSRKEFGSSGRTLSRLESRWSMDNWQDMKTLIIGDTQTRSTELTGSANFAGVKWGSNFSIQPNFLTYYKPNIQGTANAPTVIDIYANNIKRAQQHVKTGPYTLQDLPMISGAGDLVLEATDITGKTERIVVPYFIAPTLLKKDLSDFTVEAGIRREQMYLKDFDYKNPLVNFVYRYGLTNWLTTSIQAQAMKYIQVLSTDNSFGLAKLGVITLSGALSREKNKAGSRVGLSYSNTIDPYLSFGGRVNYNPSRPYFTDIALWPHHHVSKLNLQSFVSLNLNKMGTISCNYTSAEESDGDKFKYLSSNYMIELTPSLRFNASIRQQMNQRKDKTFLIGLHYQFDGGRSVSASYQNANHPYDNKRSSGTKRIDYTQALTEDTGVSYRLQGESNPHEQGYQAQIQKVFHKGTVSLNTYGYGRQHQQTVNASGSAVFMEGSTFLTQTITGSLAMVKVGQLSDITVYGNNHAVGTTDGYGQTLIPNLTAYSPNRININETELPFGTTVKKDTQEIIVAEKTGVVVDFEVESYNSLTVLLKDQQGQLIPTGSVIKIKNSSTEHIVGFDGVAFFDRLPQNTETIKGEVFYEGKSCNFELEAPSSPSFEDVLEVKTTCTNP